MNVTMPDRVRELATLDVVGLAGPDHERTPHGPAPDTRPDDRTFVLRGRDAELAELHGLLEHIRAGGSRALLVVGAPGIGKTALLDHLAANATGCTVVRIAGVAAESQLPYSALHRLCARWADRLVTLPAPQRTAIARSFGQTDGPEPDPFLLGLSVLSLLSEVAGARPVVCIVDDVHRIDEASAQVLGVVARRLVAESVALVFARPDDTSCPHFEAIPHLVVRGLADTDARALLDVTIPGPLDPQVRELVVTETRGNPSAIAAVAGSASLAQLAGGFGLAAGGVGADAPDASCELLLALLSNDQRQLVLLAATDPVGDPDTLWRAAEWSGIAVESLDVPGLDGVLRWGSRVTFRDPLMRAAVYRTASPSERRSAHRALAAVTDPQIDPDRRAWHLGRAAEHPDDEVALILEQNAERARTRGGLAAAAAFLDLASALTGDRSRRASRALAAASARQRSGDADGARRLLEYVDESVLDERQRGILGLLRARAAVHATHAQVSRRLLDVAAHLEPPDGRTARDAYRDALAAAHHAGQSSPGEAREVARVVRSALPGRGARHAHEELLWAWSTLLIDGYPEGAPRVHAALERLARGPVPDADELEWTWAAARLAADVWDFERWAALATRTVDLARADGALGVLATAVPALLVQGTLTGVPGDLRQLDQELAASTAATDLATSPHGALLRLAWLGREQHTLASIAAAERLAAVRGEGLGVTAADTARAVLHNGYGRHAAALTAAQRGAARAEDLWLCNQSLVELIEAAVRCHQGAQALDALDRLTERTTASGTDWALGIEARCRALVADGAEAEPFHRDAMAHLARTPVRADLARARLLYGEWLRRQRRRVEARRELRAAHELFVEMGLEAFAERAARELAATGETARRRNDETRNQLTAREAQIARMAADGLSNPEIGTRLYLSSRTVEYHLRKVFTKLDIASRAQLRGALVGGAGA